MIHFDNFFFNWVVQPPNYSKSLTVHTSLVPLEKMVSLFDGHIFFLMDNFPRSCHRAHLWLRGWVGFGMLWDVAKTLQAMPVANEGFQESPTKLLNIPGGFYFLWLGGGGCNYASFFFDKLSVYLSFASSSKWILSNLKAISLTKCLLYDSCQFTVISPTKKTTWTKAAKGWVHNLSYPLEPSLQRAGWLLQLVAWMVRLQERLVLRQGAEGMCQVPLWTQRCGHMVPWQKKTAKTKQTHTHTALERVVRIGEKKKVEGWF